MLKKGKERFEIPFRGLSEGEHSFRFVVNDRFFDAFGDSSEIRRGDVIVDVVLTRATRMLRLDFTLSGTVRVRCDRCLEQFDHPVDFHEQLIVKFGSTHEEVEADILVIREEEGILDISQFVYEYIHLSLPVKRIHPDDGEGHGMCNVSMLRKLGELVPHAEKKGTDPRWSALNGLKNFN